MTEIETMGEVWAAVSLIERTDGTILCVWNTKRGGWSMPGGKVEPDESVLDALDRELEEETGLHLKKAEQVFAGPHELPTEEGRATHVALFRVSARGEAREMEKGGKIGWLTREQFLEQSPYAEFYRRVFKVVKPKFG